MTDAGAPDYDGGAPPPTTKIADKEEHFLEKRRPPDERTSKLNLNVVTGKTRHHVRTKSGAGLV